MKILDKSLISINSISSSKEEIINELVKLMDAENRTTDIQQLKTDIYKREEEASTSMGLGIAIPHAQSLSVKQSSLVFIKPTQDILWNGDVVKVVFGIFVSSENNEQTHLKILSSLARKLMSEEFRKNLYEVNSVDEAYLILDEFINNN